MLAAAHLRRHEGVVGGQDDVDSELAALVRRADRAEDLTLPVQQV